MRTLVVVKIARSPDPGFNWQPKIVAIFLDLTFHPSTIPWLMSGYLKVGEMLAPDSFYKEILAKVLCDTLTSFDSSYTMP